MERGAVVVDEQLCMSVEDVWAAGDIVYFDDPIFGARHIELVDDAWASGTAAGPEWAGAGA